MATSPDELRADCSRCSGLCCVALGFARSADFAEDKPARTPCRHLRADFGCSIHGELTGRGFGGCVAYDCFGAGQLTTQVTFGGTNWRTGPHPAGAVFGAFETLRKLQELRWYVRQAAAVTGTGTLGDELTAAGAELAGLARSDAEQLGALDPDALRERIAPLLRRTAEQAGAAVLREPGPAARSSGSPAGPQGGARGRRAGRGRSGGRGRGTDRSDRRGADLAGRDLIGADLRHADLRGASLRGALLIAADLRGARLDAADLIGADLRDADLRGTDLSRALFLTSAQVAAARGDGSTALPPELAAPTRWERRAERD